jgi:hypothetical protein
MKMEMITHKYPSNQILKKMLIKAAMNVDKDKILSLIASVPLAIKLPEFNFFH